MKQNQWKTDRQEETKEEEILEVVEVEVVEVEVAEVADSVEEDFRIYLRLFTSKKRLKKILIF